jgi:hypothetical protein
MQKIKKFAKRKFREFSGIEELEKELKLKNDEIQKILRKIVIIHSNEFNERLAELEDRIKDLENEVG